MNHDADPLYSIFEQHLFNAMVEEETTDEFLTRVVQDYLQELTQQGTVPNNHLSFLESDLREEVLEMLRKKTYGHYNLSEYRKARVAARAKKKGSRSLIHALRRLRRPS